MKQQLRSTQTAIEIKSCDQCSQPIEIGEQYTDLGGLIFHQDKCEEFWWQDIQERVYDQNGPKTG